MADRKRLERIKLLTGTGRVYEGSQEIATVSYRVEVFQEKIESQASGGTSIANGPTTTQGEIKPAGAASISVLFGKALTLVFKDGRKLDCEVANMDISMNMGTIIDTSGAGIH